MFSATKICFSFLSVSSLNDAGYWGNYANCSHRIECFVGNQAEAGEKTVISSNKVDETRANYQAMGAWQGEWEGRVTWLPSTQTVEDNTDAESWIHKPRKALAHSYPLQENYYKN